MHSDRLCLFTRWFHKRRPLRGGWEGVAPHVKTDAARAQCFVTTCEAPHAWRFICRVGDSFTKARRWLRALVNRFPRARNAHTLAHTHAREFFNYLKGSSAVKGGSALGRAGRLPTPLTPQAANAPGGSWVMSSLFLNFLFLGNTVVHQLTGAAPPPPEGREGADISPPQAFRRLLRSLRRNGWKAAPNVGGVGHSCDLPLGHSCDLPKLQHPIYFESIRVQN